MQDRLGYVFIIKKNHNETQHKTQKNKLLFKFHKSSVKRQVNSNQVFVKKLKKIPIEIEIIKSNLNNLKH